MKRTFISLTLVVILLAAFTVPAMASDAEDIKAALALLKAQFPGNEQIEKLVSDANTWIASPEVVIPEGSAAIVTEQINAAKTTAGSITNLAGLSEAARNSILGNITAAANVVELKFTYSIAGGVYSFTLTDSEGNVISTATNNPIKQTGLDVTTIIIITIGITVLFGVVIIAALATGKKRQQGVA